jgi:hypothetical protein
MILHCHECEALGAQDLSEDDDGSTVRSDADQIARGGKRKEGENIRG